MLENNSDALSVEGLTVAAEIVIPPQHPAPSSDSAAPDPFNPERLRLSLDMSAANIVSIPPSAPLVQKPNRDWWFRTNPNPEYELPTCMLQLEDDKEIYLVDQPLWSKLGAESACRPRLLMLCQNKQGIQFLWPLKLNKPGSAENSWNKSALEAAKLGKTQWVRLQSNEGSKRYDIAVASGNLGEPVWNLLPMGDLLRLTFKNHFIDTLDHPVLKQLRGEE